MFHLSCLQCPSPLSLPLSIFSSYRDRHPSFIYFHHCSRKTVAEPVGCTLPVFVDMANFTSSAPPGIVSRLYPTPLPRPISIQYSVTWRPTSSLSPCDTTIHLFALGPISVFVSRYTWYECAAGREKQSQNLIEKTYSWTCCTTAMTCQGPRIHLSGPATWKWALLGTTLKKKKKKKKERAWQKERNKRWKWEMTENAQVDKENNWVLLHGHFLKSIAMWKAQL